MRRALILVAITAALRAGDAQSPVFRSVSSSTSQARNDTITAWGLHWRPAPITLRFTYNSDLPYSLNDGAQWAGRGGSGDVVIGGMLGWGPLRLVLAPEYTWSANLAFPSPGSPPNPIPVAPRMPYSSPWHGNGQSIDLPYRFGAERLKRWTYGQSSLSYDWRNVTVGVATENEWWGPGIRNALILSSNAPGFEHAFLRPRRPVKTRWGTFDARWIVGTLRESGHFDIDTTNDLRSISLLGVTWSPPNDSGLIVGFARSVFSPAPNRSHALTNAFQVFADVGHPNAFPYTDSTITPGRDQLFSFFLKWDFPKDGFSTWAEWARAEMPRSPRDFLIYPNHTQGYTLGLSWTGEPQLWNARLRAQAEFTYLEQSTTYRHRDMGSWYTSRAVVQGYTNLGQPLGAAIGPGSSSQFIAVDYLLPHWGLGVYANRVRWLEDAHSQQPYPPAGPTTYGWCEHDVSLGAGTRAFARTRFGNIDLDYSSLLRLNIFFENPGPCPIGKGRDARNESLTLTISPRLF